MKKIVRSIAMVAIMFASATNMANEPKLRAETTSKSLVLELDAQSTKTSVKFLDSEGEVIYFDTNPDSETYIKKFDLSTLPEGTYFIEIENDLKELVYTINIDTENIGIGEKHESLKPVFRKQGDKVLLNLLNLNKENVEIKILDAENRVVFNEQVSNEIIIQKAFNFSGAKNESYSIVVKDANGTYYENVLVK